LKLQGKPSSKARNYAKKQAVTQDQPCARSVLVPYFQQLYGSNDSPAAIDVVL
jgi:hypothetical protein